MNSIVKRAAVTSRSSNGRISMELQTLVRVFLSTFSNRSPAASASCRLQAQWRLSNKQQQQQRGLFQATTGSAPRLMPAAAVPEESTLLQARRAMSSYASEQMHLRSGGGIAAAGQESSGDNGDTNDGLFYAAGMLAALMAANVLAVWCEFQMDANESLLQGVASLGRRDNSTNDDETSPPPSTRMPATRRRTTRIVHLKLPSSFS